MTGKPRFVPIMGSHIDGSRLPAVRDTHAERVAFFFAETDRVADELNADPSRTALFAWHADPEVKPEPTSTHEGDPES